MAMAHEVEFESMQDSPVLSRPLPYSLSQTAILERLHQVADDWASRHASRFAPAKYGLIYMWKKGWGARRVDRPPSGESITLQVRPTSSLKYLGVMLDEHLTGESQIA
ncbi:reverse transcriptase [Penicillium chrysogenum]|uniref:reverse transcriptase n=1 Tax=Penicillium chrysogenum TaxID=5076 RepID=UPI002399A13A|nr:reverse transcriptase [Penicillium chrysogenum]KAJ5228217.1 reverse transcriptase [Penicillium chrysogenum]KAJ5257615.1 reverse transcriptase [Penicillium chrysogenum]